MQIFKILLIAIIISSSTSISEVSAEIVQIASIKSLTHTLSKIEKNIGEEALYVTLKLQIYLEDIYISQGTIVKLKSNQLEEYITMLFKQGLDSKQISKIILNKYKDGEFHE